MTSAGASAPAGDTPLYAALVAEHGDPRAEHVAGELPPDAAVNPVHDGGDHR